MSSASSDTSITRGALRMRASRQRRREGKQCVTLDIRNSEVQRLIDLGYLQRDRSGDKNELLLALYLFLDNSDLGVAHQ